MNMLAKGRFDSVSPRSIGFGKTAMRQYRSNALLTPRLMSTVAMGREGKLAMVVRIEPPSDVLDVPGPPADPIDEIAASMPQHHSSGNLEVVELELSLDPFDVAQKGFAETVSTAVKSLGGDYLFSLPGTGLAAGYQKIAAVRLPGDDAGRLVFVLLDDDGTRMEVRLPDDETSALARFSTAFVEVLEQL